MIPVDRHPMSQAQQTRASIGVTPRIIHLGDSALLAWNVAGADTIYISHLGRVPASGTRKISPTYATLYTLVAGNGGKIISKSARLTVSGSRSGSEFPDRDQRFNYSLSCRGTFRSLNILQDRILTVLQDQYRLGVDESMISQGTRYVFLTTRGNRPDLLDASDPTIGARRVAFRITVMTRASGGAFHYTIESLVERKKRLVTIWRKEKDPQTIATREAQNLRDRIHDFR